MPDEAREVIFPNGVPVTMIEDKPEAKKDAGSSVKAASASPHIDSDAVSTEAETGLHSEAGVIKEQALEAQPLHEAENFLPATPDPPPAAAKHS